MRKIEWHEGFSVGVVELDEQHKQLIGLLNLLADNQNCSCDSETFSEILTQLTAYARYHFAAEEKMLRDADYPDYASHAAEHTEFKHRVATFCVAALRHETHVVAEAVTYLQHWFMHHILIEDMKYKSFLQPKPVSLTPSSD